MIMFNCDVSDFERFVFFFIAAVYSSQKPSITWTNITSNQHMRGSVFITGTSKIIRRKVFPAGTICLSLQTLRLQFTLHIQCKLFSFLQHSFRWYRANSWTSQAMLRFCFSSGSANISIVLLDTVLNRILSIRHRQTFIWNLTIYTKIQTSRACRNNDHTNFQMHIFQILATFSFVCTFTMHFQSHQLIAAMI